MSKYIKILSIVNNILRSGLLLILVLALIWGVIQLQKCNEPKVETPSSPAIKKEVYRPPVVKTPITPDKPPVEKKKLPIPSELVKRTIELKTETLEGRTINIILVEDKKSNFYTVAGQEVKVTITEWKPKLIAPEFKFGYSLVASNKIYHCLSLDYIRVWRFYLGSEIGVGVKNRYFDDYLIGLSLKYKIWELSDNKNSYLFSLTAGYNFLNSKPYIGINLKF